MLLFALIGIRLNNNLPHKKHISTAGLELAHLARQFANRMDMFHVTRMRQNDSVDGFSGMDADDDGIDAPDFGRGLDLFPVIARLLSSDDDNYIARRHPELHGIVIATHRRILVRYAESISSDLEMLWLKKRAIAEVDGQWDFSTLWQWWAETNYLAIQFRFATMLYGRGAGFTRRARKLATNLEELMTAAMADVALASQR